jgi:hypothetical protein
LTKAKPTHKRKMGLVGGGGNSHHALQEAWGQD